MREGVFDMRGSHALKISLAALLLLIISALVYRWCQPVITDTDNDKVVDKADNCPTVSNPEQGDKDGDGRGDSCDPCPDVAGVDDRDLDCVADASDNCPSLSNRNQADRDKDGLGDVCDDCPADPTNEVCQDWFKENYVLPVTQWAMDEQAEYTVCIKRDGSQPDAFIMAPRFDNMNLRLDKCRVYKKGSGLEPGAGTPLAVPRIYSMGRPVGIGCPDHDDSLIDVIHWRPGEAECVTVPMNILYSLDPDTLGMEPADTLVCELSGRFVTKGVKDPGPPVFEKETAWDASYDWCRDPQTGLIDITPVDQILPTISGVGFLFAKSVEIDIQPDNSDSFGSINPGRSTGIPVAVLGSKDIDVSQINQAAMEFDGSGFEIQVKRTSEAVDMRRDVDKDGFLDMVVHVDVIAEGAPGDEGYVYLNSELRDGSRILGRDRIRLAPSKAQ